MRQMCFSRSVIRFSGNGLVRERKLRNTVPGTTQKFHLRRGGIPRLGSGMKLRRAGKRNVKTLHILWAPLYHVRDADRAFETSRVTDRARVPAETRFLHHEN